jgi:uncharacterized repeat protein (TIGR02543 family)
MVKLHRIAICSVVVLCISACGDKPDTTTNIQQPQQQQPATPSSVLDGAQRFTGVLPAVEPVTWRDKTGQVKLTLAHAGLVAVRAKRGTTAATVTDAVRAANGVVVASVPLMGDYLVQTTRGSEASVISALAGNSWAVRVMPDIGVTIADILVADKYRDDPALKDASVCLQRHGEFTSTVAGSSGATVLQLDLTGAPLVEFKSRIATEIENAKVPLVVNLSMQSEISYTCSKGGCTSAQLVDVELQQYAFLEGLVGMLDDQLQLNQKSAKNTILVVAAGNAGVDLYGWLQLVAQDYPAAFAHMKVVGGITKDGTASHFNYSSRSDNNLITYANGQDVSIKGQLCSGTSFAAPEVARVLDLMWQKNPNLSGDSISKLFDAAVDSLGKNNILPYDTKGLTTQAFLDYAFALARGDKPGITYTLTIQQNGDGAGRVLAVPAGTSFASGTIVTLNAAADAGSQFTGWAGDCTGVNTSCNVTMSTNRTVTATFRRTQQNLFTLTVLTAGTGTGTVSVVPLAAGYAAGTNVSLLATPNGDSDFGQWQGACQGTSPACIVTMTANLQATAVFNKRNVVVDDISGNWQGTFTTNTLGACPAQQGTWSGRFQVNGTTLNYQWSDSYHQASISGSATMSGSPTTVTFTVFSGGDAVTLMGTFQSGAPTRISGTLLGPSNICFLGRPNGTWQGMRTP